jgi:hypothetical protein
MPAEEVQVMLRSKGKGSAKPLSVKQAKKPLAAKTRVMKEALPSPGAAGTSVAVAYRDCVVDALSGAIERERAKDNQALARCFLQLYEV